MMRVLIICYTYKVSNEEVMEEFKYFALVMHHTFSSHSDVYAIFSSKELAEAKKLEFEEECKSKYMGIWAIDFDVQEIDMKKYRGWLPEGTTHEKINVVNCVPSVAKFTCYPESTLMEEFVVDECKPLEWA